MTPFRIRLIQLLVSTAIIIVSFIIPTHALPLEPIKNRSVPLGHANNELIVKFKKGSANKIKSKFNLTSKKKFKKLQQFEVVTVAQGQSITAQVKALKNDPSVLFVEPNYLYFAEDVIPNDPQYTSLWGMQDSSGAGLNMPPAWQLHTSSDNVVVGVIDTGINYNHEDLIDSLWVNPNEIAGNGIDDDQNGWVDDIYGIDTFNNDADPLDDNEHHHGTHVAGTIAGSGNNNLGIVGVSWQGKIASCKFLSASGSGSTEGAIACIDYFLALKEAGINIIATNNSWGGGAFSQALKDAIASHQDAGILFIAAAGNNYSDNDQYSHYPSNYNLDNIISVAAIDRNGNKPSFSNYGAKTVDVSAPGVDIISSISNDGYQSMSGTSMASPHVTGLAALLAASNEDLKWFQLKNLLMSSGKDNPNVSTFSGRNVRAYDEDGHGGVFNCQQAELASRLLPSANEVVVPIGKNIDIAFLNIRCANAVDEAITVSIVETDETIILQNDPDNNDGVFHATWPVPEAGTFTLSYPDQSIVTVRGIETADYLVVDEDYQWVDTTAGNCHSLALDSYRSMNIGFEFQFYGQPYKQLYFSSTGLLGFDSTGMSNYRNVMLPNLATPNNIMAVLWQELHPRNVGKICTLLQGEPGERSLTINWNDFSAYSGGSSTVSFSATLYESSNDIVFQYKDLDFGNADLNYGKNATVGLEDLSGMVGLSYLYRSAELSNEMAIRFIIDTDGEPRAIAGADQRLFTGDTATFDGSHSLDFGGEITSYLWQSDAFPQPMSSAVANFTFDTAGSYPVLLTVTDNEGFTHSDELIVTVADNIAPIANAGEDKSVILGTTFQFDGGQSTGVDDALVSYLWQIEGLDETLSGINPNYIFPDLGEYTISLTIEDAHGASSTDVILITVVPNTPPVAIAGADINTIAGSNVTFSGSASSDVDGQITSYQWDSEAFSAPLLGSYNSFQFTEVGTFTVTLTVTDDAGASSTDEIVVNVVPNQAPVANAGTDISIRESKSFYLRATSSYDNDGSIVNYQWQSDAFSSTLTGSSVSTMISAVGTHVVTLTVTDNLGASSSDQVLITVNENQAPIANARAYDYNIREQTSVGFRGNYSSDPDGSIVNYQWQSDGFVGTITGRYPTARFDTAGEFTVTLTVTDDLGATATDEMQITVTPNQAPIANAGSDFSTVAGAQARLSGTSSRDADGSIQQYQWSSDQFTAPVTGSYPMVIFTELGEHIVSLTVTDDLGATTTDEVTVTVVENVLPTANAGADFSAIAGAPIRLTGLSSRDSDGSIANYEWQSTAFASVSGSRPYVTFAEVGTYTVILTVTDNVGATATDELTVTVLANQAPIANAGEDISIVEQMSYRYSAQSSTDPDGSIVSYLWESPAFSSPRQSSYFYFTPPAPGDYVFTLTVTDDAGATTTDELVITASANTPPVANAGVDQISVNRSIYLYATGSSDAESSISYQWESEALTYTYSGSRPRVTFPGVGNYLITLTVTDAHGATDTDTVMITIVDNLAPIAIAGEDVSVVEGSTVTFDGSQSYDTDQSISSYRWQSDEFGIRTGVITNYTFETPGIYPVTLSVTDSQGAIATDEVIVTVLANILPVANAGEDITGYAGDIVTFDARSSYDDDGSIISYQWQNDHFLIPLSGQTATHSFNEAGSYIVNLIVSDNRGGQSTDEINVTILPQPCATNFKQLYLRGSFNSWGNSEMQQDPNSCLWHSTQIVDDASNNRFKFDRFGDWSENYGDDNGDGKADKSGDDILITAGEYRITFDDLSHDYTITEIIGPQAPTADAGKDISVRINQDFTLDASNSTDVDGDIVDYSWLIIETGETASGELFTTSLSMLGSYQITLTVTDNDGLSATDTMVVTIANNTAPVANASDDIIVSTGSTVNFNAGGSIDADGSIVEYRWQHELFTSDLLGSTASFTFDQPGEYLVILIVTDNEGASASDSVLVTVSDQVCDYQFETLYLRGSFNGWGTLPMTRNLHSCFWESTVTFADSSNERFKFDLYADWSYNLGDDDQDGYADRSEGNILVTGNTSYTITFNDNTNAYTVTEFNEPQTPIANAGVDQNIKVGSEVTFDASGSFDNDGSIISYEWDNGLEGINPSKLYDAVGIYTVSLTVTDNDGNTASDSLVITVAENQAPIAEAGEDITVKVGEVLTLDASGSIDLDGKLTAYQWDNGLSGMTATTSFNSQGVFVITLSVTDDSGAVSSDTVTITVLDNVAPIANAGEDISVSIGQELTLDASASLDDDGTIVSYSWDNGLSGIKPSTHFNAPGIYLITLIVTDDNGATSSDTVTVTVLVNEAPIANAGMDIVVSEGENFTLDASVSSDIDGTIVSYVWDNGLTGETVETSIDIAGTYIITLTVTDNQGATMTDTLTVIVEAASTVEVTFTCNNGSTTSGTSVYIVGNIPELGNWAVNSSEQKLSATSYPTWHGEISLQANQDVDWKCVKANEDTLIISQWQGGANNSVNTGSAGTASDSGSF